jgi:hypothetical protein
VSESAYTIAQEAPIKYDPKQYLGAQKISEVISESHCFTSQMDEHDDIQSLNRLQLQYHNIKRNN